MILHKKHTPLKCADDPGLHQLHHPGALGPEEVEARARTGGWTSSQPGCSLWRLALTHWMSSGTGSAWLAQTMAFQQQQQLPVALLGHTKPPQWGALPKPVYAPRAPQEITALQDPRPRRCVQLGTTVLPHQVKQPVHLDITALQDPHHRHSVQPGATAQPHQVKQPVSLLDPRLRLSVQLGAGRS